jgi:hypothetical protein
MLFDLTPIWNSKVSRHGLLRTSLRYKSPPMPFNLSVAQAAALVDTVPGVRAVRDLQLPPGRGRMFNAALSMIYRRRLFQSLRPCLALLEFD